ncbi:MAG TPA: DUF433 domain-containing protein, partial [Ktedonobacterales bacterium]
MAIHPQAVEHVQERDGELYIGQTRVTLSSVISAWEQEGQRPERIPAAFPAVSLAAAYGAVAYYLDHQEELDRYFEACRREFERLRAESQAADPAFHARLRERMETLRTSDVLHR